MTLQERWQALEPRERWLVALAAAVAVVGLFYVAVWEPLTQSNQQINERVAHTRELVSWLQLVAPEARRLRGSSPPGTRSSGTLLNIVDASSKTAGLDKAIARLQPHGQNEVRLWLEKAPYQTLMRWLLTLEKDQGVIISELSISRGSASGLVSARAILKRGS